MTDISSYIDAHLDEAVSQLGEYVALESVGALGQAIPETAAFVKQLLSAVGAKVEVLEKEKPGHPVVVGELQGSSSTTLLLYNHYDVQPAEPFDLWTSPPFEVRRDGDLLYGRGISDNKGHLISRLLAIKALQDANGGSLPITIKFLIEGDEEIGSPKLEEFVKQHQERLASDVALHEGGGVNPTGRPLVSLGVKGIFAVQMRVRTAVRDSHSSIGVTVPNAAWRLVWALASLKDADERIRIDGFYDDVKPPTEQEEAFLRELPSEEESLLERLELSGFVCGVRGYDYQRRLIFEPTCTINGISGGYEGKGMKTVLPAEAGAKLDFRLVPDQDPDDIAEKLRKHLDSEGFEDVQFTTAEGEFPARTDASHPFVEVVRSTAREVYGQEPITTPNAPSTQPLHPMMSILGVPMASAGISNPDGRAHAPDENIRIPDFISGTKHVAAIIERLGEA
ncbi:MAG: M20/M25/M40 family metallo-hydrolase [Chloroflexi bacterium]|nr:M20/M25/M40 family metallo-hydrolase [Chloroflexota bacterium]MCI0855521.1 M20/M25/M40 family metallo-hydrolase [Chloroflexota bacterium]